MFKINVDDIEYEVVFRHCNHREPFLSGTACWISRPHHERPERSLEFAGGNTNLKPGDQYNRNFGRKLSLARALKDAGFPKEVRKMFWDKYFEVVGKKNKIKSILLSQPNEQNTDSGG